MKNLSDVFEHLGLAAENESPRAVVARLIQELRERRDYQGLFYGLLLERRLELGLAPVSPGRTEEMTPDLQDRYEDGIRRAARTVGGLYLADQNIPAAWPYFRMIGEPGPVRDALDQISIAPDDERIQPLIEIALHEGVHPRMGLDLVIRRYGICSAITTLSQELPIRPEDRLECTRALVRSLHGELCARLAADIERREGSAPLAGSVAAMIQPRPWLFEDEFYHIDLSHLGSVVQFALDLPPGAELDLAIELCEYGTRISPRFQHQGSPPFERHYQDYLVYLKGIAGREAEAAVEHFRVKAEGADPEQAGTYPAEVFVNLLSRLGRDREAAAAFTRFLAQADGRRLACPSLQELCTRINDFQPLVETSLRRGDLVNYVAGLLQGKDRNA